MVRRAIRRIYKFRVRKNVHYTARKANNECVGVMADLDPVCYLTDVFIDSTCEFVEWIISYVCFAV